MPTMDVKEICYYQLCLDTFKGSFMLTEFLFSDIVSVPLWLHLRLCVEVCAWISAQN